MFLLFLALDKALFLTGIGLFLGGLVDHGGIGLVLLFLLGLVRVGGSGSGGDGGCCCCCGVVPDGEGVFELLCEVLVDGLTALEDGSSIFKALNLFKDKTCSINFVLLTAVDGDDALPVLLLLVRQDLDLRSPGTLNDVPDHVPL